MKLYWWCTNTVMPHLSWSYAASGAQTQLCPTYHEVMLPQAHKYNFHEHSCGDIMLWQSHKHGCEVILWQSHKHIIFLKRGFPMYLTMTVTTSSQATDNRQWQSHSKPTAESSQATDNRQQTMTVTQQTNSRVPKLQTIDNRQWQSRSKPTAESSQAIDNRQWQSRSKPTAESSQAIDNRQQQSNSRVPKL